MSALHHYTERQHSRKSTVVGFALMHLLAFVALFYTTYEGVLAFLILYCLTGCLGITLCYHRLLSHHSFKASRPLQILLLLFGCLANQGKPCSWVAAHRLHHKDTDKEDDPHSPQVSLLWSHCLWFFYDHPKLATPEQSSRYLSDLERDPVIQFFEKYYDAVIVLVPALMFLTFYLISGWEIALSVILWGVILRSVCFWHVTWCVNSASHRWGYRSYPTDDTSRNNWWVAFLAFGEGWHNNHHAYPRAARNGHRWYEVDVTYAVLKLFQLLGLASHVVKLPETLPSHHAPLKISEIST